MSAFEITLFINDAGPLTKRISLDDHGKPLSDGSACLMTRGSARRVPVDDINNLAELIPNVKSTEAFTLGALRDDLPDNVKVTTKVKLTNLNGSAAHNVIARTAGTIMFRAGKPAFVLLDYDVKGIPQSVADKLNQLGGFWLALISVLPELKYAAHLIRNSTSAGLFRCDTGEEFPGSGGLHIYLSISDGSDADRFLQTLHQRCWLSGLGWMMVGAGGQLLERSIVDRMVGAPERLVFEGPPTLIPPLLQHHTPRLPIVTDGEVIDTLQICPPLTIVEQAALRELKAREAHRLAGQRTAAREHFIAEHARILAEQTGIDLHQARNVIAKQCDGILLPSVAMPFDNPELAGTTVADVLADPGKFEGETLADPLEGIGYGPGKAKLMRRADGTPWINSFAHGRTIYQLRYSFTAAKTFLENTSSDEVAQAFVDYALQADLTPVELETLRDIAHKRADVGKRSLDKMLKDAKQKARIRELEEEATRQLAERRDPRPLIEAPLPDAPWLPQMEVLNTVLGNSNLLEPPMRDINGVVTKVRVRRTPYTHTLTARGANQEEDNEQRLPPPDQPLLTRLDEAQLAELIEQHIDYVDPTGRSVHLGIGFVNHFIARDDDVLPLAVAIATLPIVLSNGEMLCGQGLDRKRGIVFRIPKELRSIIPRREDCTDDAVAEAMEYLTETWLCDVATDYIGKCILIAAALTIIERSLLPDRPAFWVTAGRRGGGKTTAITMILMAVTGLRPAAAAWSPNEEERRKALLAYLIEALAAIVWDNIPRGTQISCPHIEKSCTAAMYSDRKLGVSQTIATSAATIHLFTGNAIGPKGDLASRSLKAWLEVDRADPENRPFEHPDPIGWTEANRGKILKALYTILLGNPRLKPGCNLPDETRFKAWHRLVGSAVEHAAQQYLAPDSETPVVSFKDLFIKQEEDDEESASLSDVLSIFADKWPLNEPPANWTLTKPGEDYDWKFTPSDVAAIANKTGEFAKEDERQAASTLRDVLFPRVPLQQAIDARSVTKRLKPHLNEPVRRGDRTLILKSVIDTHTKCSLFYVEAKDDAKTDS
ncbi:MAG: hypothetical protein JO266_19540 [Acidobacteria bacterium]|nr:hypothetical protein [Acidobacteriota bacterium]